VRRLAVLPALLLPSLGLADERVPAGAASCLGCHGGGPTGFPSLDGLTAERIADAMAAFRDGHRAGSVMNRIARGFSQEESRAIAEDLAARGSAR